MTNIPALPEPIPLTGLKLVKVVRAELADGRIKLYYRHKPTKKMLGDSDDHAAVQAQYDRLTNARKQPADLPALSKQSGRVIEQGTIAAYLLDYFDDEMFTDLEQSTQDTYKDNLLAFTEEYGHLRPDEVTRKMVKDYRKRFKGGSHSTFNHRMANMQTFYAFLMDENITSANPFWKFRRLSTLARDQTWTREQVRSFLGATRWRVLGGNPKLIGGGKKPKDDGLTKLGRKIVYLGKSRQKAVAEEIEIPWRMRLAIMLAIFTCQRRGDLLRMTWSNVVDIEGRKFIKIIQNKTKKHKPRAIYIPITKSLWELFKQHPYFGIGNQPLIPAPAGGFWVPHNNFTKDFILWRRAAGVEGVTFHDLRRTGMVWLKELGVDIADIAAVSGHSIQSTHQILETYLPRTKMMAERAITAMDKAEEDNPIIPAGALTTLLDRRDL